MRQWTAEERDYLKTHYNRHSPEPIPVPEIARVLGRTEDQVYNAARRMGLRRPFVKFSDYETDVRRLHSGGASGGRIARTLSLKLGTVCRWLARMGLSANGCADPERKKERRDRHAERVLSADPRARTFSEATVLMTLDTLGCWTRAALMRASGLSPSGLTKCLRSLRGRGLVTATRTRPAVYTLVDEQVAAG